MGLGILSDQPVRCAPRYLLLPEPKAPLAATSQSAEHLFPAEEEFGEGGIELQHLAFVVVFQAARLFPVEPTVHDFASDEFVIDGTEGTVGTVFAEEHLGRNTGFVQDLTSILNCACRASTPS